MSADDYPGTDGETLRRQRLPGAAERWESLPWENRMSLLGALEEEAASFKREAGTDPAPVCDRYRALATTWETAHAVLMRADTVSSKDKSSDEVAAERAKYGPPRTPETVLRAMIASYGEALTTLRAALWSGVAWTRTEDSRLDALDHALTTLHNSRGAFLAGPGHGAESLPTLGRKTLADYEARLSGARPIDAPPPEGT